MRSAELRLGFRAPASDAGLPRNGGDGRYDIYLARQPRGVLGQTACSYQTSAAAIGRRWSSTELIAVQPLAIDPDRQLRETLAHEYFHGIQCRIVPRLNLLPLSLVEGTANWMAANVVRDWARPEGTFLGGLARADGAGQPVDPVGDGADVLVVGLLVRGHERRRSTRA